MLCPAVTCSTSVKKIVNQSFFFLVTYTPGGLSAWGRESPLNSSRFESPSSSPRSDRRDMDSIDRRRYKGYVYLSTT